MTLSALLLSVFIAALCLPVVFILFWTIFDTGDAIEEEFEKEDKISLRKKPSRYMDYRAMHDNEYLLKKVKQYLRENEDSGFYLSKNNMIGNVSGPMNQYRYCSLEEFWNREIKNRGFLRNDEN